MRVIFIFTLMFLLGSTVFGQQETIIKCTNHEARSWWDTKVYDLQVNFNIYDGTINGSVIITSDIVQTPANIMQIDLLHPMTITAVSLVEPKQTSIQFSRMNTESYMLTHSFSELKSKTFSVKIEFKGKPKEARNAPWDAGFVYTKDSADNIWWAVACQGYGASVWIPCKNAPFDEPKKVSLHYTVPENYMAIGNGTSMGYNYNDNLKNITYHWEVNNTINLYNITFYLGKYEQMNDTFVGINGNLPISYFCLKRNETKAKKHFQQVKPMLACFEEKIGAYPFYDDGYRIVESPYLGMEHQSAIAYGNKYLNGYLGKDRSESGVGLMFDFIIVHESGHEWFGNSITAADVAYTWIQEGFTTYTETILAECRFGKQQAYKYQRGKRALIKNDTPIEGIPMQCHSGSGDHYDKAAYMIHTIRTIMNDDNKFYKMLRTMTDTFKHQIIDGKTVEQYLIQHTDNRINIAFFDQYLRSTQIPILVIEKNKYGYYLHWENVVKDFTFPVIIEVDGKEIEVKPNTKTTLEQLIPLDAKYITVSEDYLMDVVFTKE